MTDKSLVFSYYAYSYEYSFSTLIVSHSVTYQRNIESAVKQLSPKQNDYNKGCPKLCNSVKEKFSVKENSQVNR
jgi:hypothetical protein